MSKSLRIAVADDEPDMREYFGKILPRLGHSVVAQAATGPELVAQCRASRPDLVITDIQMPEQDGIDASREVCRELPVPVILVSAHHDPDLIQRAGADHVMGYLVKPVRQADLGSVISLSISCFERVRELRQEVAELLQALEERKLVEQAKGVLMKQGDLDEGAAFGHLRRTASDRHLNLIEAARTVLVVLSPGAHV